LDEHQGRNIGSSTSPSAFTKSALVYLLFVCVWTAFNGAVSAANSSVSAVHLTSSETDLPTDIRVSSTARHLLKAISALSAALQISVQQSGKSFTLLKRWLKVIQGQNAKTEDVYNYNFLCNMVAVWYIVVTRWSRSTQLLYSLHCARLLLGWEIRPIGSV